MLASGGIASANPAGKATFYGGAYSVSKGFEDRRFAGAMVDYGDDSKTSYHAEVSTIDREESATFGALGVTWRAKDHLKAQVRLGTSTDNDAVAPDIFAYSQLTFEPRAEGGWALSPSISYSHYRSEDWETIVALEGVRYANLRFDRGGYYVFQLRGAVAPNSSDEVGYSVSATITTVRANGLSLGLGLEAGRSQYETSRALPVRSDFVAVRPIVSYRLNGRTEIFARGEFANTDSYDVRGAMLGVKIGF